MFRMSRFRGLALAGSLLGLLLALGCSDDPRRPPGPDIGVGGNSSRGGSGGDAGSPGGSGGGGAGGQGGTGGTGETTLRILDVRPPRGSILGGDTTIISGVGFISSLPTGTRAGDVTEVTFGGNPSVGIRVIDDDTIIAQTPPGAAGDVDVLVRNPVAETVCAGCFRYQAPVTLSSVEPPEGPIHGGTEVVLRGENLRESMVVLFGGRAALSVTGQSDGSLVVLLPPGDTEGRVDVRVFDVDGEAALRKGFQYRGRLAITSIDPPGGPLAGGNEILLSGTGFSSTTEVRVGGRLVTSQLDLEGRLRLVAPPAQVPGAVVLEVRSPAGTNVVDYAYFDPMETNLSVLSVSPAKGSTTGGNEVLLVGTGFDGSGPAVYFDGVLAPSVRVISANFLGAVVPGRASVGAVDVTVRTVEGGLFTLDDGYRYVLEPHIDDVLPSSGPMTGGTSIEIRGVRFPENVKVYVGALQATSVERISDSRVRAISPRGSEGWVPVRIVDAADVEVEAVLSDAFRYEGAFSLARIEPTTGAQAGGTRTIVRGTGFRPGMSVSFGRTSTSRITIEDPFTAVVYTPRGEVGTVDVDGLSPAGEPGSLPASFTYFDPGTTAGGSSGGPLNGALNVTVLEDSRGPRGGFPLEGALVILGSDDSTPLQGLTDSRGQITFSSTVLVKAQTVTAALFGYQSTTVVNQSSENLTILLAPNFELGPCEDGIDNDGDGQIDMDDPNCMCNPSISPLPELCGCPQNPMEQSPCCDGIDNDGDGLIDSDDPDCGCSGNTSEGPLPECGNCIDDDDDGLIDFRPPPHLGASPDPGCSHANDNSERGAIVTGRVWGFKKPRPLNANEQEVAFVRMSVPDVYRAEPISRPGGQFPIFEEGSRYAFEFSTTRNMALYAVYGILNHDTGAFEPLFMGIRRGLNPVKGQTLSVDIVLDMHLDKSVPVTLLNPPRLGGVSGGTEVYAYMDVGPDGVIPLGSASTTSDPSHVTLRNMPTISGENTIFLAWSGLIPGTVPLSASYRRQAGDLSQGITIGPLLGLNRITEPTSGRFNGTIAWAREPGPQPDLYTATIEEPTPAGWVTHWHMVLPGTESQVTVPHSVLLDLRSKFDPGTQLLLILYGAREPRFAYEQWSYDDLNLPSYTSFTLDQIPIQL